MITKVAYEAKMSELVAKPGDLSDRWHTKAGALNAKGKTLKTRVFDYLDAKADHAGACEVRDFLVEEYPEDYCDIVDGKPGARNINNRDVLVVAAELVKEDKVVE